ncbi:MAG: PilZ domain-containing protein [Deltaproteobacteria bacterium]|nr:MAG: PilZ domain-containing protein [Deltaproteobacteria bacterium]
MPLTPSTCVLDDGELDEVRSVLQELGVEYAYVRGEAIPSDFAAPARGLLIATPRRAMGAGTGPEVPSADGSGARLIRIVVVGDESESLRARLREVGFDFLVRQPIHREAMRLLILRALYHGPEHRRIERLPVGCDVGYRSGWRSRRGHLLDLSGRGCRLLTPREVETGKRIQILLTGPIAAGRRLAFPGRAVRCLPEDGAVAGAGFNVGVEFEELSERQRGQLREVLNACACGPLTLAARDAHDAPSAFGAMPWPARLVEFFAIRLEALSDRWAGTRFQRWFRSFRQTWRMAAAISRARSERSRAEPAAAPPREGQEPGDRRGGSRHVFLDEVFALKEEADRVLMGRDISTGGMRVDPHSGIAVGDRFELALYGSASEEPLIVEAVVERDDGERGLALRFEKVGPATAARLERFVVGLPPIEPLRDRESDNLGAVVSEIRWHA